MLSLQMKIVGKILNGHKYLMIVWSMHSTVTPHLLLQITAFSWELAGSDDSACAGQVDVQIEMVELRSSNKHGY